MRCRDAAASTVGGMPRGKAPAGSRASPGASPGGPGGVFRISSIEQPSLEESHVTAEHIDGRRAETASECEGQSRAPGMGPPLSTTHVNLTSGHKRQLAVGQTSQSTTPLSPWAPPLVVQPTPKPLQGKKVSWRRNPPHLL